MKRYWIRVEEPNVAAGGITIVGPYPDLEYAQEIRDDTLAIGKHIHIFSTDREPSEAFAMTLVE